MRLYHYQSLKAKPPHLPRQSPGENKRREVSWTLTKKLAQKRSRAGRWCWATGRFFCFASVVSQRRSYGHCLCESVLHSSWGQQLRGAVVGAQCRTDTALTSCCSGGGPRQPWSSGLAPISRFHFSVPLSHSSPSLIGLLASVDVKQQKLPRL